MFVFSSTCPRALVKNYLCAFSRYMITNRLSFALSLTKIDCVESHLLSSGLQSAKIGGVHVK